MVKTALKTQSLLPLGANTFQMLTVSKWQTDDILVYISNVFWNFLPSMLHVNNFESDRRENGSGFVLGVPKLFVLAKLLAGNQHQGQCALLYDPENRISVTQT